MGPAINGGVEDMLDDFCHKALQQIPARYRPAPDSTLHSPSARYDTTPGFLLMVSITLLFNGLWLAALFQLAIMELKMVDQYHQLPFTWLIPTMALYLLTTGFISHKMARIFRDRGNKKHAVAAAAHLRAARASVSSKVQLMQRIGKLDADGVNYANAILELHFPER